MQEELDQRGMIEPLLCRPTHRVRGSGTFDGGVHLGKAEMKFIGKLEIDPFHLPKYGPE